MILFTIKLHFYFIFISIFSHYINFLYKMQGHLFGLHYNMLWLVQTCTETHEFISLF